MKNIVIAGTGGLASEVTEYLNESSDNKLLGYLDHTDENMARYEYSAPFLGSDDSFNPTAETYFIVAIAKADIAKRVADLLIAKGLKPYTLIHHTCQISKTATIGYGNIIAPFSMVGPKSTLGNFNLINYYTAITHDVTIGNWNSISPRVTITGGVKIGHNNIFGTGVSILPFKTIGDHCKIQSGTVLHKDIGNNIFARSNTILETSTISD